MLNLLARRGSAPSGGWSLRIRVQHISIDIGVCGHSVVLHHNLPVFFNPGGGGVVRKNRKNTTARAKLEMRISIVHIHNRSKIMFQLCGLIARRCASDE